MSQDGAPGWARKKDFILASAFFENHRPELGEVPMTISWCWQLRILREFVREVSRDKCVRARDPSHETRVIISQETEVWCSEWGCLTRVCQSWRPQTSGSKTCLLNTDPFSRLFWILTGGQFACGIWEFCVRSSSVGIRLLSYHDRSWMKWAFLAGLIFSNVCLRAETCSKTNFKTL